MGKRLTELDIIQRIDELTKENVELRRQIEDRYDESYDEIDDLMIELEDRQSDLAEEYEEQVRNVEREYEEELRPYEKEYDARAGQIKRYQTLLKKRAKAKKKTVKK